MPYGFRVAFVKIRRGSNMAIFTGAGVAIVTPFKEDESIAVSYTHLTLPTT